MCFIIITFKKGPLGKVLQVSLSTSLFFDFSYLGSQYRIENHLALIFTWPTNYSTPPPCSPSHLLLLSHLLELKRGV